jgi:hypothetical protein
VCQAPLAEDDNSSRNNSSADNSGGNSGTNSGTNNSANNSTDPANNGSDNSGANNTNNGGDNSGTNNSDNSGANNPNNSGVNNDGPDADLDDGGEADVVEPDADPNDGGGEDVAPDMGEPDVTEPDVPMGLGPRVEVEPAGGVDFGEVGQFASAFQTVTIRNVGDEVLTVVRVGLESEPSQGFQVIPPVTPLRLEPEAEAEVRIRFQPLFVEFDGSPTEYGNALEVDSDDPTQGRASVPLVGVAVPRVEQCLTFGARELNFGFVEPGEAQEEEVELINCGTESIEVLGVEVVGQAPAVTVSADGLPWTLGEGERRTVAVSYAPTSVAFLTGSVVARAETTEAELTLRGGPTCPEAVAGLALEGEDDDDPSSRLRVELGQRVVLIGSQSDDPAGGGLTYEWSVEGPAGSRGVAPTPSLRAERVTITPDAIGSYTARLRVASQVSGLLSCEVDEAVIEVLPADPAAELEMRWDNQADLDLHLVRANAEGDFGDFGSSRRLNPDDCYFGNLNPDWGAEGDPLDDPYHLGDDQDGEGPEGITVGRLEPGGVYRIGVNYADRRFTREVEAGVTLRLDGQTYEWERVWDRETYWIPATFTADGEVTVINELLGE